ncbi:MAG: hypothetical protein HQK57_10840 [Deltaproteobacteria bacterium]|nr:hypothetical protein [Deltaproteobacteria bacterium]MBF0524418.1 hypothetical protein [Deltaproteobacteria bacterium]
MMGYLILGLLIHTTCPILMIWSINTLFQCGIPYGFKTWLAGLLILLIIRFYTKKMVTSHDILNAFREYTEEVEEKDEPEEDEKETYFNPYQQKRLEQLANRRPRSRRKKGQKPDAE